MTLIDTNIILRYILNDHTELSKKSIKILENKNVCIKIEIIAEVVYILEKLYKIPRKEIVSALQVLFSYKNIEVIEKDVVLFALEIYKSKKIDLIDTILISYNKIRNFEILSFDKDILKNISAAST